ncbi:MAG: tetratricopeptide repeat protein, partial [Longimicrobiales bacterium]
AMPGECKTNIPEAHQAYTRGNSKLETGGREDLRAALNYFQRAVALDTSYACAYAGLAETYTRLGILNEPISNVVAKGREAAERALTLDSTLVAAHTARAHQLFSECKWRDAEKAFERALALDSRYALARRYYGLYLHFTRRHDAALAQLHSARNLDPRLPGAETLLGRVFVNTSQPDSAIRYLQEALVFKESLAYAYQQLAHAYLQKRMHTAAVESMQRAAELSGARDSAQLAYIYAATGNPAEARRIVQRLVDTESQRDLPAPAMAMAYAGLGDADEAFRWLDKTPCASGLAVTAGFESIRSDPRFDVLLRRIGLLP